MHRNASSLTLQTNTGIFWFSTAILIILAVFGVGLDGIAVGSFNIPPFILYLVIHAGLTLMLMISRSEYVLDIPNPMFILLLFAIYVLGSSIWAVNTISAIKVMALIVSSILTALFIYWGVTDRWTLSRFISVLKIIALIGIVIAILEITTGMHLPVSKRYGTVSYYKSTAWYVNENDFSMFLAMVSALFLAEALSVDRFNKRLLGTGCFVAILIIVMKNESRAGLLAVCVVGVLLVGLHFGRDKIRTLVTGQARPSVFTPGVLFVALTVIGVALVISNPFDPLSSRSLWFRWRALELGVHLLFDTVLGVGVGSFPTQWGQIGPPPDVGVHLHIGANSHNWFVTFIGEYGFVGTVLFLLAYGRTLDGLFKRYLRYGEPAVLGLLGALLSFAIAGLSPSTPMRFQIQWIIFGLGIAAIFRVQTPDVPDDQSQANDARNL